MTFSPRSIRYRLLLLIASTVLAVVAIHDIAAYLEVRRSSLTLATERLDGVASRFGDMLRGQARGVRQQVGVRAHDPAFTALVSAPTDQALRDSARAVLGRYTTANVDGYQLWGSDGRVLITVGSPVIGDTSYVRALMAGLSGPDSVTVGGMHRVRDSLHYAVVGRTRDSAGAHGYLVEWRRAAVDAATRKQILDLIGTDAAIYFGNTGGSEWSDFAQIVAPPPVPLSKTGLVSYDRDGVRQLASAQMIDGTPWTLLVEFPEARVYANVRSMLQRVLIITLLLLTVGLGAAWLFGARLTKPLTELADAADAMSAGDYSRRVDERGSDEVGRVAQAFNHMGESIAIANRVLRERSEELAHRAEQLADQATMLEESNEELLHSVEETLKARDELAAVTAELDASLAGAPVGLALHDSKGRYRRVNASLATLNGIAADDHLGRLPSEVLPGIGSQIEEHVNTAIESGTGVLNVELTGKAGKAGRDQHWLLSVYPIRTVVGERIGVGSVVTDLTAYKHLEQQLLQAQKMEAVGRLAGGVAHDFNNILTAISGFGQFVLSDLDEGNEENARRDVDQVLAAAERAAALTRQLLAFSRQQVLQPRILDLNAVVTGLGPMLGRLIGTNIRLRTTAAVGLGAVKADPHQMEQVLVNLVVNARDAMPNGGSITIETADAELDAEYAEAHEGVKPGSYVMLAVTDSGLGMDAATQAQIFEPFFTTKGREGTGLGLSTVYGIVKQSGGSIEVYSEVGKGTSFKIYLPRCAERAERETPVRMAAIVPNGRATVLLVDDDQPVSAAAQRTLERAGYMVLSAANGREALALASRHTGTIDLLITDLVMPEIGGRQLARQLSRLRPSLVVLYTSGYTAEAMNQQAVLEEGDSFLGKPFTPDGLLRRVHEVLQPVS
jgi:PAS domain S-box-containing protein